eukprot:scaffold142710_cov36-Attheya_sp.AAC.2
MDAQHGFRQVPLGRGNVNDMEKNDSSGYGYLGIPEHAVRLRLSLAKSPVLTANIKFAATQAMLLHILYTRGVIPCLAQELLSLKNKATATQFSRDESSNGCRKRPRKEERKRRAVLQCASELEALLADLNQVFDQNCSQITSVVMTLGPSIMSPREQYVIVFHDAASVGLDGGSVTEQRKRIGMSNTNEFAMQKNAASKDKIQREISRRIIQEFLRGTMEASNMFASPVAKVPPSSRKLNIAFLFKDSPAESNHLPKINVMNCPSNEKENVQSKNNVSKNDEKAQILNKPNDACLVVRRFFSIRTPRMVSKRKNIHRPFVILDIATMKSASSSDENFQEQGGQWMSLRRTLKGFRH